MASATGPLRVHPANPRYFADGSGKAIYLTGSHPWNNLPDGGEVTVDLSAARTPMAVEWFNPRTAEMRTDDRVDGGAQRQFQAPFGGDAVLYLRRG